MNLLLGVEPNQCTRYELNLIQRARNALGYVASTASTPSGEKIVYAVVCGRPLVLNFSFAPHPPKDERQFLGPREKLNKDLFTGRDGNRFTSEFLRRLRNAKKGWGLYSP